MGAWDITFDGSDAAADWFHSALGGCHIDDALEEALRYTDNTSECRAAVYLLTTLGRSAYVWPGSLDKLDGFVQKAASRMEAMIDPESEVHRELVALWGDDDALFSLIRQELDDLKSAHKRRLFPDHPT